MLKDIEQLKANKELFKADPTSEEADKLWRKAASYYWLNVRAQIDAARLQGAKGFILWNATGRYTPSALAPPEGA